MITELPDGRIFKTIPFISIEYKPDEKVYKYVYTTDDRIVKSSARHEWGIWDKKLKQIYMKSMSEIDKNIDELLVQINK